MCGNVRLFYDSMLIFRDPNFTNKSSLTAHLFGCSYFTIALLKLDIFWFSDSSIYSKCEIIICFNFLIIITDIETFPTHLVAICMFSLEKCLFVLCPIFVLIYFLYFGRLIHTYIKWTLVLFNICGSVSFPLFLLLKPVFFSASLLPTFMCLLRVM